jgi:hypothetical protein
MPLLLDLLPSGLTIAPTDVIVVVCLDGVVVESAEARGLVGQNAETAGLTLIGATATGRVFLCDET